MIARPPRSSTHTCLRILGLVIPGLFVSRRNCMKTPQSIQRYTGMLLVIMLLVSFAASTPLPARELGSFIVRSGNLEAAAELISGYGGQVTSRLEIVNSLGATLPLNTVEALRAEPAISAVLTNASVKMTGNGNGNDPTPASDYPDLVGADLVWEAGVTGEGVTVAIVDTGLSNHPGLLNKVNGVPQNRIAGWVDFVEGSNAPKDPHGHGTHIAGIIANTQEGSDGEYNGIAPGVRLVGVRVLDEYGFSDYENVIQGIQWVIDHKDEYNIKVMNLSLVSDAEVPYWYDPLNQAVMQAWANGITVVVAAGNGGAAPLTIGVPGNNPYVITVGAFTDNYTPDDWSDDFLAPFSAAGPTLDAFTKPDLLAPGAHMVSTIAKHSTLVEEHPESNLPQKYFWMAGTSQASAVVSGLAALTIAHQPDLTPDEVKYRLMVTALPWIDVDSTEALYSIWQQGAGRVNGPDAVFADLEGSANLGLNIWADLSGEQHYEGWSYFDPEIGEFRLRGEFSDWTGGYGAWAGEYGPWTGGYGAWAGGYGAWAGGYGAWAGGYGAWAGGYGAWAGGYGAWAGGYGAWAGGYGAWAGGYGAWAGGYGAWAGSFPDQGVAGISPDYWDELETRPSKVQWVDFDG
jgi:serine protease AprX